MSAPPGWNNGGLENIVWRDAVVTNCIFSCNFRSILCLHYIRQKWKRLCPRLCASGSAAGNLRSLRAKVCEAPCHVSCRRPTYALVRSKADRPVPGEGKLRRGGGSIHKRRGGKGGVGAADYSDRRSRLLPVALSTFTITAISPPPTTTNCDEKEIIK